MQLFTQLIDCHAITRKNAVYRQVDVYKYKTGAYIKHGTGFVRIYKKGNTAIPHLRIEELILDSGYAITYDQYERAEIQ